MDYGALRAFMEERGQPDFRADQVREWLARGATGYGEMTNLPAALREDLEREVPISTLTLTRTATSTDGTVKALFETADRRPLEAVLMRYRDGRRSVCLSSQSGCPLTCTFCATGTMQFGRNLTGDEIVDQALHFRRIEPVDHAVFMGMGEPMMNLDAVFDACERLPEIGIANSKTTVSTVGWLPGIERMANEGPTVRLALSLHAPEDSLRSEIMPVNDRYPIAELIEACLEWRTRRKRKVFVEYLMLDGVNDSPEQARQLASLLGRNHDFKVNLIPFNPSGTGYTGSSREAIEAFRSALVRAGVHATVRLTRGRDIDAACGQLAARETDGQAADQPPSSIPSPGRSTGRQGSAQVQTPLTSRSASGGPQDPDS